MNKIEALNYVVDNASVSDEWAGAGLYDVLCEIIKSESDDFEEDYLKDLIERGENF